MNSLPTGSEDELNGKSSKNQIETYTRIHEKAVELCKQVLLMTTISGSGNPSSSLSLAHIITVLMYEIMHYSPQNPWSPANDCIILSEGHVVPIVYAAYADLGGVYGIDAEHPSKLSIEELKTLRQICSPLDGHPNPQAGFPFFDCATGSLGQGLSCAIGQILSARLQKIKKHVYVIIGDGEGREGQVWEACDYIIDHNLYEIIPVFNCNGHSQTGPVTLQQSSQKYVNKLRAFGFQTFPVEGHDPEALIKSFRKIIQQKAPSAIIAQTIKGWGVPHLQDPFHNVKSLKESDLTDAFTKLEATIPNIKDSSPETGSIARGILYPTPAPDYPADTSVLHTDLFPDPDFEKILQGDPYIETFRKGIMSTRRAFGLALRESGYSNPYIVCLDADVCNSTFSNYFADAFPDRFFQCGIAEQNMMSMATGLAKTGYIPFVSTFAKFMVRAFDQLELALISGANIKLCGSHAGVNTGADGPSQMGTSDLSYMCALSTVKNSNDDRLMTIFNPSCAVAAFKCVQTMMSLHHSCYLRTIRQDLPILYSPDEKFEPGDVKLIIEGKDVAMMASGYMVHACKKVVEELQDAGIHVSLYDCYTLPIKPQIIYTAAENNNGKIITVEDNYGNGLGAQIASIAALNEYSTILVKQLFVKRIPKSGITAEDVLDFVGLGV
ncbi:MAG TPA: transketolase [Chitinispirillaceae bacterium]|nr:transketolase [Chitinispirillaceae bacterium]